MKPAHRERIRAIMHNTDGNHPDATAEAIIADATPVDSILHERYFKLDDAAAAHQHRLDLARADIRSLQVVTVHGEIQLGVPEFLRDVTKAYNEQGYRATATLVEDPAAARETIRGEVARVESALKRVIGLVHLIGGVDIVNQLLVGIKALKLLAEDDVDTGGDEPPIDQHVSS